MTIQELENKVKEYMLLADDGIVKLLAAYPVCMQLEMPPPWLFIIGPSSGGKSMLLNALADVPGYIAMDDLTQNAFLSGAKLGNGKEASFLYRIRGTKNPFLVFKDFTTILSKGQESRQQVIGVMRKIYDGELNKSTGTGEDLEWKGKMGVLGGSTSTFHTKMADFADMGERIILYTFAQPNDVDLGNRIFDDTEKFNGLVDFTARDSMREAFRNYVNGIEIPETLPRFTAETREELISLASLTTRARSGVERDKFSRDKTIVAIHMQEQIARFLKELIAIAYGLIILNQNEGVEGLTDLDKRILYRIALESIPMTRKRVLTELAKRGTTTAKSLSEGIKLSAETIERTMQDLHAHGLVTVTLNTYGTSWNILPNWKNTIDRFAFK